MIDEELINKEYEKVVNDLKDKCKNNEETSTIEVDVKVGLDEYVIYFKMTNFYGEYYCERNVFKKSVTKEEIISILGYLFRTEKKDFYEKIKEEGRQRSIKSKNKNK